MFKPHYWTGFNSFSREVFEALCGGEKSPTSSFRMRLRTSSSSPSTAPDMCHPSCVTRGCSACLRPHPTLPPCSPSDAPLQVLQPRAVTLLCLGKGFPSSWSLLSLLFSLEIPVFPPRLYFTVTFSVNVLHDLFPLQTPELGSLPGLRSLLSLLLIPVIQTITLCYNFNFAYIFLMRQYYEQLENKYLVLKFMHVT